MTAELKTVDRTITPLPACCESAIADAVEDVLDDISEGLCDPELAAYLTAAVYLAINAHYAHRGGCGA